MCLMGTQLDRLHSSSIFTVNCMNWMKNNSAVTIWYLKDIYIFVSEQTDAFWTHNIQKFEPKFCFRLNCAIILLFWCYLGIFNIVTLKKNWCSYCVPVSTRLIMLFSSLSQSRNKGVAVTTGSKIVHHRNRRFLCICNFRKSMDNMKTKWQSRSHLIFINIQFWDSLECFSRHGNVSVDRSHLIMGLWRCLFER